MAILGPQTMISMHGAEFAPGRLVIENHAGLLSWHGTMEGTFKPLAQPLRLVAMVGDKVYLGEALIKSLSIPHPDDDQPPTNEYLGTGPLRRFTLTEMAEILSRALPEEGG